MEFVNDLRYMYLDDGGKKPAVEGMIFFSVAALKSKGESTIKVVRDVLSISRSLESE